MKRAMDSRNPSGGILDEIVFCKKQELAAAKQRIPLAAIRELAEGRPDSTRPFEESIRRRIATGGCAVIAEIKRASPSKGVIREDFDPVVLARAYERAGAACISVLTDAHFFQGCAQDLQVARDACAMPALRKDFLLDPYQVYEARAMGADCILLIAACLDDGLMKDMADLAASLGMAVLLEVHDAHELERALRLRSPLLGINNRDLRTFDVSLSVTLDLLEQVPHDRVLVTESGVTSPAAVGMLREAGVDAFLVGEAFLKFEDPGEGLRSIFGNCVS